MRIKKSIGLQLQQQQLQETVLILGAIDSKVQFGVTLILSMRET